MPPGEMFGMGTQVGSWRKQVIVVVIVKHN
jgi:hypothetical protein